MYVTTSVSVIVLAIFVARAVTLPGSSLGLEYYLTPRYPYYDEVISMELYIKSAGGVATD